MSGDVQIYLVTSDRCGGCVQAKEQLRSEIESGAVIELSLERNPVAGQILDELGVKAIPALLFARRTEDGKIAVCNEVGTANAKCVVVDKL